MRTRMYVQSSLTCQAKYLLWLLALAFDLNHTFSNQRLCSTRIRATCALGIAMDKSKAAELNAGIRTTIEQLANETDAATKSELFRNYLKTSAAFWDYSWHNQMLIWRQRPDASYVGGFHTWLKCNRYVRKGEKGIAILAPMFLRDKRQAADGGDEETQRIWFKVVYVFDISQTDGAPLPELPTRSVGERGEDMLNRLLAFAEPRGITVRFVEKCS